MWKSSGKSSLWLYGSAGCGKTVLSSSIIETLLESRTASIDSTRHSTVLYFYFDFNDVNKQSLDAALRSLIHQLYTLNKVSRQGLDAMFSTHNDGRKSLSTESMLNVFLNMILASQEVYIILDALDECDSRVDLLRWLKGFMQTLPDHGHMLVTSRYEADITSALESDNAVSKVIALHSGRIYEDIRAYVHYSIREDDRFKRWRDRVDVQKEIEKCLTEKADGM